jgi:hypothetical protein
MMSTTESMMSSGESAISATESAMSGTESVITKKKRRTPDEQDRELSNFIAQSKVTIETILNTPEIFALVAPRGFDAAKLADGLRIQAISQDTFTKRQEAIGAEASANLAVSEARKKAYVAYNDFRETARVAYRSETERRKLGVIGTIPSDTEKLLTQARASLATAGQAPHSAIFNTLGYDAAGISSAMATIEVLHTTRIEQEQRRTAAIAATATRNDAATRLKQWMQDLKRIARVALRARPELLGRL